jgi:hypothetical protein
LNSVFLQNFSPSPSSCIWKKKIPKVFNTNEIKMKTCVKCNIWHESEIYHDVVYFISELYVHLQLCI